MLKEIAEGTKIATEKKAAAQEKEKEIIVFSREITVEKVGVSFFSSVCLSVCLSGCLSVCLSVRLHVSLTF